MENSNQRDNSRFKDKGNTICGYMDKIFVCCPKCSKRALISKTEKGVWGDVELKCPNCHFYQKNRFESYDQEIKFFCSNCSERVSKLIENVKTKKDQIKVKCPNCRVSQSHKPRYIKKEWVYESNGSSDPFLRLPLWLSTKVKGNIFWAYNYEHLNYMKNYIEAKLRTRHDENYTSLVEKLPSWLKSEKNRGELLKRIVKLELK